jgi:hypothetical protein
LENGFGRLGKLFEEFKGFGDFEGFWIFLRMNGSFVR